jgi:hypothetical protein
MVYDEVTFFVNFKKKKQDAQVKTRALSRKIVSLLSTYFISMHNNQ